MPHIYLIHSSVDRHSSCFHVLAVVNSASINIGEHVSFWSTVLSRWGFPGASTVKRLPAMQETRVRFLGQEDPLEKEMAIHSSTFAWKIPWTEEPDRLQSMGLQRVGHDWATSPHFTSLCPDICPRVGLLNHMVILFLLFWWTFILFSIVAAPIYIPKTM